MPNKEKDAAPRDAAVDITFTTVAGVNYTVLRTDDYDVPVWVSLVSGVPGTGGNVTVTDNTWAGAERYYRIQEETTGGTSPTDAGVIALAACNVGNAIFGMPLVPYSTALADVVGWQMTGGISPSAADWVSTWNLDRYQSSFLVDTGGSMPTYDGLWYDTKSSTLSTDTISWGEGFWLLTRTGAETVYVEGAVPSINFTFNVPGAAGAQRLVGQPYPVDVPMNIGGVDNLNYTGTSGATPAEGDNVILRNCADGAYRTMFLAPTGEWWDDGMGASSTEILQPGEGFWLRRGSNTTGSFTWTYPKPY